MTLATRLAHATLAILISVGSTTPTGRCDEIRLGMSTALTGPAAQLGLTFGSLEGYIAGRILVKALQSIDGTPTRESVVKALEGMGKFDIGLDKHLELSREKHQACHRVWPTVIRAGEIVPFQWTELNKR